MIKGGKGKRKPKLQRPKYQTESRASEWILHRGATRYLPQRGAVQNVDPANPNINF